MSEENYKFRVNGDQVCKRCGAYVDDIRLHDEWHAHLLELRELAHEHGPMARLN